MVISYFCIPFQIHFVASKMFINTGNNIWETIYINKEKLFNAISNEEHFSFRKFEFFFFFLQKKGVGS